MKTKIQVTGFRETKSIIRIWTCYPHMLGAGNIVDTDIYIREIDLPSTVNARDHGAVVATIQRWRETPAFRDHRPGGNGGTVILAYQAAVIASVTVDTTEFPPRGTEGSVVLARWDVNLLTKKVFVCVGEKVRIMPFEQLQEDVEWLKGQIALTPDERAHGEITARDLNRLTVTAFDMFVTEERPDSRQNILKLNQATFVALCPEVTYRPEPSLNSSDHPATS